MNVKKMIMTAIGMCLLACLVLPTATADITTREHVVTFLEANANTGLAQDMLPNILDSLVELYKTKTVESADISRYGAYLSRFQNLKSLFYEVAEWAELSESAVLIGEYFVLSIGMDPLQQYGRYLHTLEINQRLAIEAIVWNKNLGTTDRRSRLGNSLRELNLFDSERDLQSFVNTVFVAYIHSHLWVEEKREDSEVPGSRTATIFEVTSEFRIHSLSWVEKKQRLFLLLKNYRIKLLLKLWRLVILL